MRMFPGAVVLSLLLTSSLAAQNVCPPVPQYPHGRRFVMRQYTNVNVLLTDPKFQQCARNIQVAAWGWMLSNANVFGATFTFDEPLGGANDTELELFYIDLAGNDMGAYEPTAGLDGASAMGIAVDVANTNCEAIGQIFAHELGHAFGLGDCETLECRQKSLMGPRLGVNDTGGFGEPTTCDEKAVQEYYATDDEACDDPTMFCSPILLDLRGDGVELTSGSDGVDFDLDGNGRATRIAWTSAGSDDAWLAFDRNGNGQVDHGLELFGDRTPQHRSPERSGYAALGVYDALVQGGNGDGVIDRRDAIWPRLVLWQDRNHDGLSTAEELLTMDAAGVTELSLDYRSSGRRDRHGNLFRYRAKVTDVDRAGRWSYDVFLRPGK